MFFCLLGSFSNCFIFPSYHTLLFPWNYSFILQNQVVSKGLNTLALTMVNSFHAIQCWCHLIRRRDWRNSSSGSLITRLITWIVVRSIVRLFSLSSYWWRKWDGWLFILLFQGCTDLSMLGWQLQNVWLECLCLPNWLLNAMDFWVVDYYYCLIRWKKIKMIRWALQITVIKCFYFELIKSYQFY